MQISFPAVLILLRQKTMRNFDPGRRVDDAYMSPTAFCFLNDAIIESCFESMPRRRDTVLKAKGWHANTRELLFDGIKA